MIRHICMFKLKEENREENVKAFVEKAQDIIPLPQVRRAEVVTNAPGAPESNYDVCLIFDFDNLTELQDYQIHPVHQNFVKFVGTIRESRANIDIEI